MAKKLSLAHQTPLLRAFSRALRLAELAAALLLLTYLTSHLPSFFSQLRRLATGLLHPHFIFILGNSIVGLLLHLYRHFPSSSPSTPPPVYQDLLNMHEQIDGSSLSNEVVFEDKEVVEVEVRKLCKRSKSERFEKKIRKGEGMKELRRSETEIREKKHEIEEEGYWMSAEEAEKFRKTVEEFIEKQARFHREESLAIVAS
ncbi:hypothetical protein LUZ60_000662 [Juncus effusus]|nr:hypothetical protein LUZ60_000662 [Juncus effusus]